MYGTTFESDQILDRLGDLKGLAVSISRNTDRLLGKRGMKPEEPPGSVFVRQVAAKLAHRAGNLELSELLTTKAAVAPAQTNVAGWAAELSQSGLPGFILSLQRQSAIASVLASSPQVSLLDVGAISVPVSAAAPPATIVAEAAPIPLLKGTFTALSMAPWKLAAIASFTVELARSSNIEQAVRAILQESISAGMDLAAFSATPPAGLLQGLTPVTAASTGTSLEKMLKDFQALLVALNAPSVDVIFAMAPSRYAFATALLPPTWGYRLAASTAIASDTVVAVDSLGIAAAIGEPTILTSESSAIHESDTPTSLSQPGALPPPNTVAAPMRSLFQTDSVALRILAFMAWKARPGAVSYVTGVSW